MNRKTGPANLIAHNLQVGNQVKFCVNGKNRFGIVYNKFPKIITVLTEDNCEWTLKYAQILTYIDSKVEYKLSLSDKKRIRFHINDRVCGINEFRNKKGKLLQFRPKKALVIEDNIIKEVVPYTHLRLAPEFQQNKKGRTKELQIQNIYYWARELLDKHKLKNWSLQFDYANSRYGICYYNLKTIGLNLDYIRYMKRKNIKQVLLHEIAHALTLSGHDNKWRQKAMAIGCNPKVHSNDYLHPPKYIVICKNYCWMRLCSKKSNNRRCKYCHGEIDFYLYSTVNYHYFAQRVGKIIS